MLIRNQHCNVSCPVFLKRKNDSGNLLAKNTKWWDTSKLLNTNGPRAKTNAAGSNVARFITFDVQKTYEEYQCLWHNKPCPTKHWPINPHCCSMFVAFRGGPSRHRTSWRQFREKSAYKHGRRLETPWHILTKWVSQNGSFGGFGPLLFNMILHLKVHLALGLGTGKYPIYPNFVTSPHRGKSQHDPADGEKNTSWARWAKNACDLWQFVACVFNQCLHWLHPLEKSKKDGEPHTTTANCKITALQSEGISFPVIQMMLAKKQHKY